MPDVEQDHRIASIASRMTQLNMIDALYVITFNRIGNKVLDQFMDTREEAFAITEAEMKRWGNHLFCATDGHKFVMKN